MLGTSFKNLILGFIAGAIATVTIHELINYVLLQQGLFPRVPWSMEPVAAGPLAGMGIPQIASDAFWGGLWGIVFALILGDKPMGSMTLKGAVMGMILPAFFGVFLLVPLITGRFPPFFGGDFSMMLPALLILAGFGSVTAWLYGFFSSGFRIP